MKMTCNNLKDDFWISVIVPVYNAKNYIRQAVESAISQSETGEVILVDKRTDKPITSTTSPDFIMEKIPVQIHSILYWLDKNNPLGPKPEEPGLDPQFTLWETAVRKWVQEQNIKEENSNIFHGHD